MTEKTMFIPGRLKSSVVGGHVAGTEDIIDDRLNKTQSEVNEEQKGDIAQLQEDVSAIESKIPSQASPSDPLTPKSYVDDVVYEEHTRAMTVEQQIASNLSSEVTRATGAESALQSDITAEISRARSSENTIANNLSSEVSRATANENRIEAKVDNEITRAIQSEQALSSRIDIVNDELDSEESRAAAAEQELSTRITAEVQNRTADVDAEETRAKAAETALDNKISQEIIDRISAVGAEETRAKAAEQANAVAISNEVERAQAAEQQNAGDISTINSKIPAEASSTNQLADKEFVNSSVATGTATFRGTSAKNLTEAQFLAWANILTKDNEDYVFWDTLDAAGNTIFKRYKYNGTAWLYEYELNNSSFTAAQWATINSLLTASHKTKLDELPTNAELTALFAGKQDVISDLETIRNGAAKGATAYQKPSAGIPSSDMAQEVQESLGLADSAYQKPSSGIPSSDMSEAVNTSLGLADSAYQKPSTGIPSSDMTDLVQSSLGRADSAYQKPNTGIPSSDLSSEVLSTLDKAVTAYQKPQNGIPSSDMTSEVQTSLGKADSAYQKPASGIPDTDMSFGVQTSLGKADSAYQKPDNGIPKSDFADNVQSSLDAADNAYQKPSTGIAKADLASDVQTSLGKADTALQEHQDISMKADKSATVSTVSYDTEDKKITKTINGVTTDVVTVAKLKQDMNLSNVADIDQSKAVKSFSVNEGTVTYTCLDDTTGSFQIPTYSVMQGATEEAAGTEGLVPAPQTGATDSYLRSDGTWVTHEDMDSYRPIDVNGVEVLGNDSVPLNLVAGDNVSITANEGDVTFNATDTTYEVFAPSGVSAAAGLVPAPGTTVGSTRFLCEDGLWKQPSSPSEPYELPVATHNELGGIRTDEGIEIDGDAHMTVNELIVKNIYIGAGNAYTDVMVEGNLHATLRKGYPYSISSSESYLFVIAPSVYNLTATMGGILIPTTISQVTVGGVVYKVMRSNVSYTGEFSLILS